MRFFIGVFLQCLYALLALLLPFSIGFAEPGSLTEVPLSISLNTVEQGDVFARIGSDGDILLLQTDLVRMGVRNVDATHQIDGHGYVSLKQLRPNAQFAFYESQLQVDLVVDPHLLEKNIKNYNAEPRPPERLFGIDSAFLNYSFIERRTPEQRFASFNVPIEIGIRAHDLLVRSQFLYTRRENLNITSRGLTSVVKDFPNRLSRLTLGDINTRSGELGGSGVFGGLNYSSEYSIAPYYSKHPGVDVGGVLETPSDVEIYVNNTLVRRERLPAGEFVLNNLPNVYGAGEARIVVTDVFGRTTETLLPYYVSSKLLKPGLHDYAYNVGFKRDSAQINSPSYSKDPVAFAYHRMGISANFTAGLRFEWQKQHRNVGGQIQWLLGQLGELDFHAAVSQQNGVSGAASLLRYSYNARYFHFRYSSLQATQDYGNLSIPKETWDTRETHTVGIGTHGLPLGAFSIIFARQAYYSLPSNQQLNFIYNVRIGRQGSLLFRATRNFFPERYEDSFFASFTLTLGRRATLNASYTEQQETFTRSTYIQQTAPAGPGLGFRFRIAEDEETLNNPNWLGDFALTLKCRWCVFSTQYLKTSQARTYQNSLAGSLAFIDDSFYLSRPIYDSFALVKAGRLDDVRVYASNEWVGDTRNGRLLVPGLTSYGRNSLSVDARDIPVNMSLDNTSKIVSPAYRTGGVARFPVSIFQGIVGRVAFIKNSKQVKADFSDIKVDVGEQLVMSVVGERGEFYLENIPEGVYRAELVLNELSCEFTLTIPFSTETIVDVGDHVCHAN